MGFSKFRQHFPWSSRDSQEQPPQPNSLDSKPQSPPQAVNVESPNNDRLAANPNPTQSQGSANQAHRNPKKLQRSPSSQQMNPYPSPGFHDSRMYANHQQGPPFQPMGDRPYMGNTPPQNQSAFSPPPMHPGYMSPQPQHYSLPQQQLFPAPVTEPPTTAMEEIKRWPKHAMPVPPMPSPYQISQGYLMPPWTPSQPAIGCWDSRSCLAVPTYELPPPDLMDYDMSYLIAFRMLQEWSKYREDRHWEEVRRMRNDYLRKQWGQERDSCTIM
ncbi:MAG: hypothetical protein Q9209_000249 [Squamulea sp. 1 TL-2023]